MTREHVIVTGGRKFGHVDPRDTPERQAEAEVGRLFVVTTLFRELRVKTAWAFDRLLVCAGQATGVDALTHKACETWGLHHAEYPAYWHEHGRRAGPIRNGELIRDALVSGQPARVLAFPGGAGTADCKRQARTAGIPIAEFAP